MNDRKRQLAIGALLVAVAVGLAIPLLRTQVRPEPDVRPAPTIAQDIGRIAAPFVYDIDFADEFHGFALWGRCTDGRDYRCERRLLVTEDGEHWATREFGSPELAAPARLDGRVVALGATRVMLTGLAGDRRVFSDDSGRTWRDVGQANGESGAELAPETMLESVCVPAGADPETCRRRLAFTHPWTGQPALLGRAPALEAPTPEPRQLPDAGWWVSGRDPSTGLWAVAASHDNARSWTITPLPLAAPEVVTRVWFAGSQDEVYVLATSSVPGTMEPQTLIAIFLSTDRGRTWTRTWAASRASPRTVGGALVTAEGALYVAPVDVGPGYRSIDGGRSFTPVLDGPRVTSIRRTGAGYLARASDRPTRDYLTSTDGVRWRDVTLP